MEPPRDVGSTWLHAYNSKLWPVVLCDDNTPPRKFMETRRISLHAPAILPAILLGKHIFIWVTDQGLKGFDPNKDYFRGAPKSGHDDPVETDSKDEREEKLRRNAFRVDAAQFQTPVFWKNYIDSEAEVKRLEKAMQGRCSRKRKRPPDVDHDVIEISSNRSTSSEANKSTPRRARKDGRRRLGTGPLPTPGPTPVKSIESTAISAGVIDLDVEDAEEDSDDDGLFVRQSKAKSDPFVINSDDEDVVQKHDKQQAKRSKIRHHNLQSIRDNPPIYDSCTIFVGRESTPFSASTLAVRKCKFLESIIKFNNELRSHIDLYEESDIQAKDFVPIGEYLQKKDFTPRLIDSGTDQRLERIVLPEEKEGAARKIATAYHTASKIRFCNLQLLCVDKLKVLYPLSPQSLFIVMMIITRSKAWGCDAEDEVREWLVDHVVQHFWSLVESEHKNLMKVMMDDDGLSQKVFQRLADNPRAGRHGMDFD